MNKRTLLRTFVAGMLAAAPYLAGCSQREPAPPRRGGKQPAAQMRIALVMKSLANEFFKTMEDGARAHQKANAARYALICNGIKDEQDVNGQITIVEQMIAQRVDALVLAPADSKALSPVCKKARDAGIAVVNIDNKLDAATLASVGIRVPFVGPDNRKGARLAGKCLAAKLREGDEVAIIEGKPNAFNAEQRKLGFQDAMNEAKAKVVSSQTANWMPDQAEKVVAGTITQHPNLKAVLCANDNMALGAVAALRSAGKGDQVLVIGYDNISAVQELMKEGRILCTIDQHADRIAVYGIEYALELLDGRAAPADKETPVDLVTAESLK